MNVCYKHKDMERIMVLRKINIIYFPQFEMKNRIISRTYAIISGGLTKS